MGLLWFLVVEVSWQVTVCVCVYRTERGDKTDRQTQTHRHTQLGPLLRKKKAWTDQQKYQTQIEKRGDIQGNDYSDTESQSWHRASES